MSELASEPSGHLVERPTDGADSDTVVLWSPEDRDIWQVTPDADATKPPWQSAKPWLISLVVFLLYGTISVTRYLRLDNGSWDLGLFTEAVKQYAHLNAPIVDIRSPGFNLLGEHFHPIIALIAPFFRLAPTAMTLLVAQALLIAASVVPITRLGIRKLGTGAGYAVGVAYGLSWGLQNAADFDFHELAFAVPLLVLSLVAVLDGRTRAAVLWALPLVLVKEDMGLFVAGIGLVLAIRGKRLTGALLTVFGLAAVVLTVTYVIPWFNITGKYPFWGLAGNADPTAHHGLASTIAALRTQLLDSLHIKLHTVYLLLLPSAFLALCSPVTLIIVLPLALRFISPNGNYWGTAFHYNAPLMPVVFIAGIDTIVRFRARVAARAEAEPDRIGGFARFRQALTRHGAKYGAVAMLALSLALADEFALGQLWTPSSVFDLQPRVKDAWYAMSLVPDGAKVETTLNLLAPLAGRTDTYWIGNPDNPLPQYVVFDDINSGAPSPPPNALQFVEARHGNARFTQIYADQYGIYVFRAVSTPAG